MNNGIIKSKESDTLRNRQEIVDQRHAFNPPRDLIRADASDAERESTGGGGGKSMTVPKGQSQLNILLII